MFTFISRSFVDACFFFLYFVTIKIKSTDDIFEGISKLDNLYKVSCFQVYKDKQLFERMPTLHETNDTFSDHTKLDSEMFNVFRKSSEYNQICKTDRSNSNKSMEDKKSKFKSNKSSVSTFNKRFTKKININSTNQLKDSNECSQTI